MKYSFKELIDIPKLQELTDELYMASAIPSAIITIDGEVLTGSGWQKICTDFHRQHPQTLKECIKSDTNIRKKLDEGESFAFYKCPRGLVDASSPVIMDGEHVANVFAGQIFLEPPDEATEQFFREQARKFSFDETEYIKAFKEVPIFTEKKFQAALAFLAKLAQIISDIGLTRMKELDSKLELQKAYDELDIRVQERTIELDKANEILKEEISERKQIEQALKKREFQLIETQKVAQIGNWDLDLTIPKFDWSNETYKLFDKNPENFVPSFDEFARLVHPNDFATMQTKFNNALESDEKPYHVEVRIINDSGREWVMEAFGKVTRDTTGKALSIFGTAQDVTERSLVDALQESEEYLKSIYEAAENIAFVVTDLGGTETKILDMSPGAEKIFQYTRNEVIGKEVAIFHPPEIVEDFPKMQAELVKNKKGYSGETVLVRKSGEQFPALFTIHPKFDKNGQIIGTIGVSIDITERKTEEEKYKKTIESSIDGFWIVDMKGNFLEVNQAYASMIGYSRNELLKMSIMNIEANEHPDETKKRIEKITKNGSDLFESKHRHKKGHIIDVEVSTTFTQDNGGMFYVFLRNITERNQMEERLRQSQKMESIGTLAGGIAHDFNNILFPIVGHSEMLLLDVPEDSPFKDGLNQIYTGALRASELVKQILTFSRQDSGDVKLMKMQPIIKEALKLIRSTIPTTIEIRQNLQSDCGAIKADPTQIHQIVINLATNAYHAMEETVGKLNIKLKKVALEKPDLFDPGMKPGAYACLSISDTGKGMDSELIAKIFDPFFTTKEKGKGTGMGLSVVHGIIKNMNGTIKVYSVPNKGTEFHVYLPLAETVKEHQIIHAKTLIQGGTERILLVDDEKAIIAMEQNMLQRLGYKVTSCSSSIEALEVFRAAPDKFDLVITDMAMPNMSGDKLSVELNKILTGIPVLLCTGFSETMSEEEAAFLGINGFLLKPIVMKDLTHKIREVLDEN